MVGDSVSENPQRSWLVDSVGLSVESLSKLHLMFDCGSLHLFPLAVEWSLTEDSYARLLCASIIEYH